MHPLLTFIAISHQIWTSSVMVLSVDYSRLFFGPVLSVIAYESEDEAIRIANDSKYGLHAAVLGTDLQRAHRVASQLRAGRVVINGMTDDPHAP
jgi:acyl-CoA reductase-like NAD-dependent aldehyde dehydrogenase